MNDPLCGQLSDFCEAFGDSEIEISLRRRLRTVESQGMPAKEVSDNDGRNESEEGKGEAEQSTREK